MKSIVIHRRSTACNNLSQMERIEAVITAKVNLANGLHTWLKPKYETHRGDITPGHSQYWTEMKPVQRQSIHLYLRPLTKGYLSYCSNAT